MNILIKNANLFNGFEFKKSDVMIEKGIITQIGNNLEYDKVIDLNNKLLTSSFVDPHVHLRDPGFTNKEDIKSGSYSAVKGGYSHIFAMPNTNPVMDSQKLIDQFNQKVKEVSSCNVETFCAISHGLKGESLVDVKSIKNVCGFSDDGRGVQNDQMMLKSMKMVLENDQIMSLHCEDERELGQIMGSMNLSETSKKLGLIGINNKSEWSMIKRDCELLKTYNCRYHVCHVSCKESVDILLDAKKNNLDVSFEVSPHHLVLNDTDIKKLDTNYKMNPPLRSKKDMQYLVDNLKNGNINIIATDHAPHHYLEKEQHFSKAPFGIVGLETSFSVLYSELVLKGKVDLKTILNAMSLNVASRFKIENFGIKVGNKANLVAIDLDAKVNYQKEFMGSKAYNSPFLNKDYMGKIIYTITCDKLYDWSQNE